MNTLDRNVIVYNALGKVFREKAYASLALDEAIRGLDPRDAGYVTRLFYGVISKSVQLDYIIGKLTAKKPKPAVVIALKIGIYMLRYMSEPDYAVVSNQTELMKKIGKRELAGFVNAVLRRSGEVKLPIADKNKAFEISVNYSCPEHIVKLLLSDCGEKFTREFLSAKLDERPHVRVNKRKITDEEWKRKVKGLTETDCGYYAPAESLKSIDKTLYTVQSRSSALAAEIYALGVPEKPRVLDLCAAPGGKAVYLAFLTNGEVTACDIHPHRVELIRSYAARMGEKVNAVCADATVINETWRDSFDLVVCDVPCSGLGVIHSKPDILLSRAPEDVNALCGIQQKILSTAAHYVKKGGRLCYSTCTIVKKENERVVEKFLKTHPDFYVEPIAFDKVKSGADGFVRLYPQTDGTDGFFVAALGRNK